MCRVPGRDPAICRRIADGTRTSRIAISGPLGVHRDPTRWQSPAAPSSRMAARLSARTQTPLGVGNGAGCCGGDLSRGFLAMVAPRRQPPSSDGRQPRSIRGRLSSRSRAGPANSSGSIRQSPGRAGVPDFSCQIPVGSTCGAAWGISSRVNSCFRHALLQVCADCLHIKRAAEPGIV